MAVVWIVLIGLGLVVGAAVIIGAIIVVARRNTGQTEPKDAGTGRPPEAEQAPTPEELLAQGKIDTETYEALIDQRTPSDNV